VKSKSYLCLAVLGLLIASLCVLQPAQAQYSANRKGQEHISPLDITSPTNITYATNQLCFNFTAKTVFNLNVADVTIDYCLDDKNNITVPVSLVLVPVGTYVTTNSDGTTTTKPSTLFSYYIITGSADLGDLSQGSHSLTVFARYISYVGNNVYFDKKTIYFTINGNSQITSNHDPESQITSNVDLTDSISEAELPLNTVCAFVGVISLVAVVSFVLFTRRRPNNTPENSSNPTVLN